MKDRMHKFFNKRVEVRAMGIVYKGVMMGADDEMLYLRAPTMWVPLPIDRVAAVRLEGGRESEWEHNELDGAPLRSEAEREDKRRYSRESMRKYFETGGPKDWPAETDED